MQMLRGDLDVVVWCPTN